MKINVKFVQWLQVKHEAGKPRAFSEDVLQAWLSLAISRPDGAQIMHVQGSERKEQAYPDEQRQGKSLSSDSSRISH